jgi:hypothetical protein
MRKESERKRKTGDDHLQTRGHGHSLAHKYEYVAHKGQHEEHHEERHDGLEPKFTIEDLKKHRSVIFTGTDGREYQSELPGSWTNAKVAADATEKVCQECRDSPHFDIKGYGANRELGRRIQKAFTELKAGKGFVMTWRIYPDKEHPRWKIADGCGCGCGCWGHEDPAPASKRAKHKPVKKAKRQNGQ